MGALMHSISTILLFGLVSQISALNSVWRWECQQGFCQKKPINASNEDTALSLAACRIQCSDHAGLWPYPTEKVEVSKTFAKININSVDIMGVQSETKANQLVREAGKIFRKSIEDLVPNHVHLSGGQSLVVNHMIKDTEKEDLTLDTDESYELNVQLAADGRIQVNIKADNFFGSRHALETLSQLVVYDDLRDELIIPTNISITDKPAYPYRGVLLDTSRNYITVESIKRTLVAMGASKLNTFHWHITDSHSFPYVSKSMPELTKYGAYSSQKIYSPQDIEEIIRFGKVRGVRVMPEFDAPAHVGEGWQNTGLVTCFNWKPWQKYCVEPPCGQLDPTKDKVYDVLEGIYGDMIEQFKPDIFHMGGDEVNFNCWNSTPAIVEWMTAQKWGRNEEDFIKLWEHFQTEAAKRVYKKAGKEIPLIMWTSTLTQIKYIKNVLPKDKYIIQIWTKGDDAQVKNLLENDYKLILSNYEALYLDCGFAGWVTDGNNWCSPYIGWQKVYENKPEKIAGAKKNLVLGEEATLWAEQLSNGALDSRLWPRSAAMAEVLWSEPKTTWRDAEQRFLTHTERLINKGVNADGIEPEWCLQYEESCPINGKFNK